MFGTCNMQGEHPPSWNLNLPHLEVHRAAHRQVLTYACWCLGCFFQEEWQLSWALLANLPLQPQAAAAAWLTQRALKTWMHPLGAVPGWNLREAVDQSSAAWHFLTGGPLGRYQSMSSGLPAAARLPACNGQTNTA